MDLEQIMESYFGVIINAEKVWLLNKIIETFSKTNFENTEDKRIVINILNEFKEKHNKISGL